MPRNKSLICLSQCHLRALFSSNINREILIYGMTGRVGGIEGRRKRKQQAMRGMGENGREWIKTD